MSKIFSKTAFLMSNVRTLPTQIYCLYGFHLCKTRKKVTFLSLYLFIYAFLICSVQSLSREDFRMQALWPAGKTYNYIYHIEIQLWTNENYKCSSFENLKCQGAESNPQPSGESFYLYTTRPEMATATDIITSMSHSFLSR